tara:strand:+ start:32061 stop:32576 length:516 start_codon:yes stop_codon:yes gene_type:complete
MKYDFGEWSVKNVKTFHGHDGNGYEASLYQGKRRVALVVEDGWGGGLQFHWLVGENVEGSSSSALEAHCGTLPQIPYQSIIVEGGPTSFAVDGAILVDEMVALYQYRRDMRKSMKNHVLWMEGDKLQEGNRVGVVNASVIGLYRDAFKFDKSLNEMPEDDALALYAAVGDA